MFRLWSFNRVLRLGESLSRSLAILERRAVTRQYLPSRTVPGTFAEPLRSISYNQYSPPGDDQTQRCQDAKDRHPDFGTQAGDIRVTAVLAHVGAPMLAARSPRLSP